jgi:hypothetical protein
MGPTSEAAEEVPAGVEMKVGLGVDTGFGGTSAAVGQITVGQITVGSITVGSITVGSITGCDESPVEDTARS